MEKRSIISYKRHSVSNFRDFVFSIENPKFIFESNSQHWSHPLSPIVYTHEFNADDIVFSNSGNTICLKSDRGLIKFEQIQYILCKECAKRGNYIAKICCGNPNYYKEVVEYVLTISAS